MREINGRFLRTGRGCEIALPDGGLALNGTIVVRKSADGFAIPTVSSLRRVFDLSSQNDGNEVSAKLQKVARLLDEGRVAEAVFLATFTNWRLKDRPDAKAPNDFVKYNFDPLEPRDSCGRWTCDGSDAGDAGSVIDVAYPGTYHDQLLSDAVNYLRNKGSAVVTEVRLTGISGITARADAIVRPAGGNPYIMEVKTGEDPPFTIQQDAIYPLICAGPHAISPDPKISQIGYSAGDLLPQMNVWIVYSKGPGQKVSYFNGCKIPAIWRH